MARQNTEISFAPNQVAVPDNIQDGLVYFTDVDGNPVWSTEGLCTAYGYDWDEQNQVCRAFIFNPNVDSIGENTSNSVKGGNNEIRANVNNTSISGQNNLLIGNNTSDVVIGNRNQLENKISNSLLIGTFANATANNSFVLGGNNSQNTINEKSGVEEYSDILGERQLTKVLFGNYFEAQGKTNYLWLNNVENSAYPIPQNAVLMFSVRVLGVAVAPLVSAGEFMSFQIEGVTMKKNSGEAPTPIYARTTILNQSSAIGLNCTAVIYTDANGERFLTISVTNGKGIFVEWVANMEITQLQTKGI